MLKDYGVFDFPNDIKVYKASSEGMIDSTQYYATTSYNSFTKTATTNVNKTGWARMTTKSNIQNDCLKIACKKSAELGYDYILIFDKAENVYEEWSDVRYSYQILFIPLNKEDITSELQGYTIYRNTLYYQALSQKKTAISSKNNQTKELKQNNDKVINYTKNSFTVKFDTDSSKIMTNSYVEYEIFLTLNEKDSFETELKNMGYKKTKTYSNNKSISLAVIEGMQHFNAIGCCGEIIENNFSYVVMNYIENNVYNTDIYIFK